MLVLYTLIIAVFTLIVAVIALIFYITRESREINRKKRALMEDEINQRYQELEKRKMGGGLVKMFENLAAEGAEVRVESDEKNPKAKIGYKK